MDISNNVQYIQAFDYEGEDALRMAEIDEKLDQFIEIHSACGTPSLTSGRYLVMCMWFIS